MAATDSLGQEAEADDDYLTMTFEEPTAIKETLTQKKKRQAREAEVKARTKSKKEIAAEEKAKRDEALNKSQIDSKSKGFKMMAALGYKPGEALGVQREGATGHQGDDRLLEPIGLAVKEDRSGIGADTEKKRKIREEAAALEQDVKRRKVDEGDFRERQHQEREEQRMEGQVIGATKVCERLDEDERQSTAEKAAPQRRTQPLSSINILWRGLVRHRLLKERDRRMEYNLHQSLSRRTTYDDPEEDEDDKLALSNKAETEEVDIELDQEDEELDEFEALPAAEKLVKLVSYLRERWHYCLWCKFQYPDESMDGCPGLLETDHD